MREGGDVRAEAHACTAPLAQAVGQRGLPVVLVGIAQGKLAVLSVAPRIADGGEGVGGGRGGVSAGEGCGR